MKKNLPTKGSIKEKIQSRLKEEDEISFAYLYGSFARSEETEKSDIDVGIYLEGDDLDSLLIGDLTADLEQEIGIDIDIRVLNHRSLTFLHQVLKKGELLFSRDEKRRVEFESWVYDRYLDFKYYIDEYNQTRRKRILA